MPKRKANKSSLPDKEETTTTTTTTVRRSLRVNNILSDRLKPSYKEVDDSEVSSSIDLNEESDSEENQEENENGEKGEGEEERGEETSNQTKDSNKNAQGNDGDTESDSNEEDAIKNGRKRSRIAMKTDDMECEFCQKKFKNAYGHKYHVNNNVCRQGSVKNTQRGKRKKSEASRKTFPRVRGKQEDRICPHCNKTFTSPLGCQYHVSKGVCRKIGNDTVPFATIRPGTKFVTPFGIVEVVRDDRAVPVVDKRDDEENVKSKGAGKTGKSDPASDSAKKYRLEIAKRKQQLVKVRSAAALSSLVRRKELNRAYEEGKNDQESVWKAHFGNDPRKLPTVQPLELKDPGIPASSFADRIVECRWVQDTRTRYLGVDKGIPTLVKPPSYNDNRPNVFLQRRMLTEPYGEGIVLHICPTCGLKLLSRPGVVYHLELKKCGQAPQNAARPEAQLNILEARANDILKQKLKLRLDDKTVLSTSVATTTESKYQNNVETTVCQAGARLRNASSNPAAKEPQNKTTEPVALAKTLKEKKLEVSADPNFVDPRIVLADLESQYRHQQSILLGPMYPVVYKALKFEKPGTKKKRKRVAKIEIEVEEKRQKIIDAKRLLEDEKKRLALLESEDVSAVGLPLDSKRPSMNSALSKEGGTTFIPSNNATPKEGTNHNQSVSADERSLQVGSVPVGDKIPEPLQGVATENITLTDSAPNTGVENDSGALKDRIVVACTENNTNEPGSTYGYTIVAESVPEISKSNDAEGQIVTGENDTVECGATPCPQDNASGAHFIATNVKKVVERKKRTHDHKDFLDSMRIRPPMIDTRVLVHEIDAGRYPSINRVAANLPPKSPIGGKCPICKTAKPPLYKCNFCFRKVHITCARLKWNLPDPEPYDDFLCTVCIQSITHRRNRAERRRIEREHGLEAAATALSVTEMVHPPIPLHRTVEKSREYEAVISQGRHMANLIDLETDARERLQREIENCTLSDLRRQMMM